MFGSDILDVAVGLIFVYLLVSLIVSAATELIAGWLGWRANKLKDGIENLINSPGPKDWAQCLYDHPMIQGMSPLPTKIFCLFGKKLCPVPPGPSYISSRAFSGALLDLVQKEAPILRSVANDLQGLLNSASALDTSAADIKHGVLLVATNIPFTSPPTALEARLRA